MYHDKDVFSFVQINVEAVMRAGYHFNTDIDTEISMPIPDSQFQDL